MLSACLSSLCCLPVRSVLSDCLSSLCCLPVSSVLSDCLSSLCCLPVSSVPSACLSSLCCLPVRSVLFDCLSSLCCLPAYQVCAVCLSIKPVLKTANIPADPTERSRHEVRMRQTSGRSELPFATPGRSNTCHFKSSHLYHHGRVTRHPGETVSGTGGGGEV